MKIEYRYASIEDIENLITIHIEALGFYSKQSWIYALKDEQTVYKYYKEKLSHQLNSDHDYIYIALHNDEIIGYYTVTINRSNPIMEVAHTMVADDIYIKENYRKQGIATKFMNEMNKKAHSENIDRLIAFVATDNIPSNNLVKKFNFQVEGFYYYCNLGESHD
ncbi:GNAT family N-acetyltransferase [Aliicoccus persicus]|uniref:L-amino acid N-acyltransferase YncA n=1 Tax=Aliicoccus persicus TaxID=930138 RepID=A0A662Z3V6_9STAP|nr:GNAT family N-acetyltransferase [Aliicoccus persicus]SEW07025.1 L-amino acid N-acyltransferase YncA [Aliicoccus persicus]